MAQALDEASAEPEALARRTSAAARDAAEEALVVIQGAPLDGGAEANDGSTLSAADREALGGVARRVVEVEGAGPPAAEPEPDPVPARGIVMRVVTEDVALARSEVERIVRGHPGVRLRVLGEDEVVVVLRVSELRALARDLLASPRFDVRFAPLELSLEGATEDERVLLSLPFEHR